MHVDEFIESRKTDAYASWCFMLWRLPASQQFKFEDYVARVLFCDYAGRRYRVTGCSRLGDVWLTENFEQCTGYQVRVDVSECGNWGQEP